MFKTRGARALEYIAEMLENYCRLRLESDKVIAGILKDIKNRMDSIDQTVFRMASENQNKVPADLFQPAESPEPAESQTAKKPNFGGGIAKEK